MNEKSDLEGLEGWLILVGIGVVVAPLRLIYLIYTIYVPIFTDGTWELLTTEGSQYYQALWAPILMGEVIYNVLVVIASFFLMYLFFTKNRLFPRFYIVLVLVTLIFIPLDAWIASLVLPNEPMFDPDTVRNLAQTAIAAVIWIPYMLVSKRVKATFVNPPEEPTNIFESPPGLG